MSSEIPSNPENQTLTTSSSRQTVRQFWETGCLKSPVLYAAPDESTLVYFESLKIGSKLAARMIINREIERADGSKRLEISDFLCDSKGALAVRHSSLGRKSDQELFTQHAAVDKLADQIDLGLVIPGSVWKSMPGTGPVVAYSDYQLSVFRNYDYELSSRFNMPKDSDRDPILHAIVQASMGEAFAMDQHDVLMVHEVLNR